MHIADLSIKRPIFISMILFSLLLFGLIGLKDMGVDLYPKMEFPVISVVAVLPGADVESVEKSVTNPLEDVLSSLNSLKHMNSKSREGVSQVVLEFELEKNIDVAYQEVRSKIDSIRATLPSDLKEPVVEKFNFESIPIVSLIVSAQIPEDELTLLVERQIKERLQKIPQIGQIKVIGGRKKKIWIEADREKLAGYNLTLQDIEGALKKGHFDIPGGVIEKKLQKKQLKTKAELNNIFDFENLIVAERLTSPIYLKDVAEVTEGLEDEQTAASFNGAKAIVLEISKQSGANTVEVAENVKKEAQKIKEELQKQDVNLDVAHDNSFYIRRSLEEVHLHLYFGGIFALLVVGVFLRNLRSTFICAIALPLAILGTFAAISALGFTQNVLTLLALSLAIGLLIDDAIVVQENIIRHMEEGASALAAASTATKEIALAVLATTLSVVATFVPVAFMKGMMGRFFYQFGLTVVMAVLISMVVSFTLTPLFSARFFKLTKKGKFYNFIENGFEKLKNAYVRILKGALNHKAITLLLALISFIGIIFATRFLRVEFMSQEDNSEFNISVETESGSSLDFTRKIIEEMSTSLQKEPWVKWLLVSVANDHFHDSTKGAIYVRMIDKEKRKNFSQDEAVSWVRDHFKDAQNRKVRVERALKISGGGFRASDIQLELRGRDLDQLLVMAENISNKMRKIDGYVDIELSYEKEGSPQLGICINREVASFLHVSPIAIASTIKTAISGSDIDKFSKDGERYDVGIRLQKDFRTDLEHLFVRNTANTLVPMSGLITVKDERGPTQIEHYNRLRKITVYANLEKEKKVLGEAINELSRFATEENMPFGYSFGFAGMGQNLKESFANLIFALFLSLVIIYMVLASQFESFLHPLIIMLALPLSLIGAIGILLLCHMTLSIMTMIAIIMLFGLVTKNGILLVDVINTLRRRDNLPLEAAVIKGGTLRLRPILMTSCSIAFGMLPIAIGVGVGSEVHAPMATAIIGGLLTSTILTLVIVPVAYATIEKLRKQKENKYTEKT